MSAPVFLAQRVGEQIAERGFEIAGAADRRVEHDTRRCA